MTIIRWILGVLGGLLAAGTVMAFVIFIATGIDEWNKRAKNWRRLTTAVLMFWFNLEIWRRVVLIIINW